MRALGLALVALCGCRNILGIEDLSGNGLSGGAGSGGGSSGAGGGTSGGPTIIATGLVNATDVAVANTGVYVADAAGAVVKVGDNKTFSTVYGGEAKTLHVTVTGAELFWSTSNGVRHGPIGGGNAQDAETGLSTTDLASGAGFALYCAGDYVRVFDPAKAPKGVIASVGMGQSPVEIAVDDTAFYWAALEGTIRRSSLSAPDDGKVVYDKRSKPQHIAVGDKFLYWQEDAGIFRGRTDGSMAPEQVADGGTTSLAADGSNAYWVKPGSNGIDTIGHTEAKARQLVAPGAAGNFPVGLVSDGKNLYWGSVNDVYRLAK